MGIPMGDNIHAPTIPSGPPSGGAHRDYSKLSMVDLMQEKERIESELSALSGVLSSHGANMDTPLKTFDGFPRNDIDVAQIRTTRARINHLRYDYKEMMKSLEEGLYGHFSNNQHTQATTSASANSTTRATDSTQRSATTDTSISDAASLGTPFAKVNGVMTGSPADQAGLRAGDAVRHFGGVNWINHERLSKVAEVVQRNEGRTVQVRVVRKHDTSSTELDLQLVPRRDWGGRGLLGCHLVPL